MLLRWFVTLVLSSKTQSNILKDLYKDVNLEYLSPRAHSVDKMVYYLMKQSIPFTVHVLRTIFNIKKLCQK